MGVGAVSPVLVGRGMELGELDAAFAEVRAGTPRVVLVGGEAGIGKTRLVREFGGRAQSQGARLLVGGCLELGVDGYPFAPFTAVLRQLVREVGTSGIAELVGGRTAGLARLLPEFGEIVEDDLSGQYQVRLFELVLRLLDRLAGQGSVVLVIEDAHWADRSSRDLLAFLVRNLGAVAPLMIIVTYRSDDLHRTHPLRPMLAELDRVDRVSRHEIGRLARREVSELMRRLSGAEPQGPEVDRCFARSEGNPLFVEALMEAGGEIADELPESLRDLLLAGVQRLPEETQELLRIAAGSGARTEHRLLAAVSGMDEPGLARCMRPAVAGNVLVVDGDGYAFRHALIREAVHDDLLPGERTRLHTRFAEALEQDPSLVPPGRAAAELAHHWYAAHDLEWALISAWRAAKESRRAAAYAEELGMLERVMELWDRVPGAEEMIGAGFGEVLEAAVRAADRAGESERGIKLCTVALKEIDDPVRQSKLLERRGWLRHRAGRQAWVTDLREALRLLPPGPSVERARTLSTFAHFLSMRGEDEAESVAEEALELAVAVGDAHAEANALITLSFQPVRGMIDEDRLALIERAERVSREAGLEQPVIRAATNHAHVLEGAGRHGEAVEVARRGVAEAVEFGLYRTQGSFLAVNHAESLFSLGRWDEALAVADQALECDPPKPNFFGTQVMIGMIRLRRGEVDAAVEAVRIPREMASRDAGMRIHDIYPLLTVEAEIAVAQGRPAAVPEILAPLLTPWPQPDEARYCWPALVVAAQASLNSATFAPFVARAEGLRVHGPVQQAMKLTFEAEAARLLGTACAWEPVIAAWESVGQPYSLARALLSAGEAHHLEQALKLATDLGAVPLRTSALDRLRGPDPVASHGLTPRELEVLQYLSLGNSNKEIAEALFISAKTASVHVSNILGKLGASTRTEAASKARQLGLVPV